MKKDPAKVTYIVYNRETLAIAKTFQWYGIRVHELLQDKGLACLNVTHPTSKALLADINAHNGTNY